MRFFSILSLLSAMTIILSSAATAPAVQVGWEFEPGEVNISSHGVFHHVDYPGATLSDVIGAPAIPVFRTEVELGSGADPGLVDLEIEVEEWVRIPGIFNIPPVESPHRTGFPGQRILSGNERNYDLFPAAYGEILATGYRRHRPIATLEIRPFRYFPASGTLELATGVTAVINDGSDRGDPTEGEKLPADGSLPDGIDPFIPPSDLLFAEPDENTRVLVVTSEKLLSSLGWYILWQWERGMPAASILVEEIPDDYNGARDQTEAIREKIKEIYLLADPPSLEAVFLVGDFEIISSRRPCSPFNNDEFPSDYYFQALDGNHDADMDSLFFEYSDDMDMYEDILVGRLPVTEVDEMAGYITKHHFYNHPDPRPPGIDEWTTRALYLGGRLRWSLGGPCRFESTVDPVIDSDPNDEDSQFNPNSNFTRKKLYYDDDYCQNYPHNWSETDPNYAPIDVAAVKEYANRGNNLLLHYDHSGYYTMGVGYEYFYNDYYEWSHNDVGDLKNTKMPSVCYSIGCNTSMFHKDDCIGESFVLESGGAVVFIGNCDYGYGGQESQMRDFVSSIIDDGTEMAGWNLADSRLHYSPFWMLDLQLFGDPTITVWTSDPVEPEVNHPHRIPTTARTMQVSVNDPDGEPVAEADVCFVIEGGYFCALETGEDGTAAFDFSDIPLTEGTGVLTVSGAGLYPYRTEVAVGGMYNIEKYPHD